MSRYDWWVYTFIWAVAATLMALELRRTGSQHGTWVATAAVTLFVIHVDLTIAIAANP